MAVEKGDPVTIIHLAIATKGELVCERYYKAGFGGDDDAVSDMLVHRNPVRKEDGSYDFNVYSSTYLFASPYVLQCTAYQQQAGHWGSQQI